ncbi:hypothetical protein B0H16DRAFT_1882338 [Mycena metata]|uniref:BTB domain-containing protein n=1 Tax=Mycena metata TaxID=1033252 RepID=A0AAD7JPH1_9AGAR|nr:hypothetical protein B0H16DRAFT_1882338 [Mycena metata]
MSDNESLEKAENLWFSPDVVILRADTRIFRVFTAILKAQSSVFADMFTFPQPPSADMESMDGFPLVRLHDKPEDLEAFLQAIFDSSFFMPPPAEIQFEHTLGILRLSNKYDVPYLRRRALDHLETTFPAQLAQYDARAGNQHPHPPDETATRAVATIKAATEVGAPWLLPVAYYDLCRRKMSSIIASGAFDQLGEQERNTCLVGYAAQIHSFPKMFRFLSTPNDVYAECDDWAECNRIRLQITHGSETWTDMTWPLDFWNEDIWQAITNDGMCPRCIADGKVLHVAARQEFWDRLPQMFGLPRWEELEAMRRVALVVS